eukprot:7765967-Pyramimonas_sp.AAC.1
MSFVFARFAHVACVVAGRRFPSHAVSRPDSEIYQRCSVARGPAQPAAVGRGPERGRGRGGAEAQGRPRRVAVTSRAPRTANVISDRRHA